MTVTKTQKKETRSASSLMPLLDAQITSIMGLKNAVVVELIDGKFVVSIEYTDYDKKPFLEDMAKDILRLCI